MPAPKELDVYYRGRSTQRLTPKLSRLSSPGHQLLITKFGPLDLRGTIGIGHSYGDLLQHNVELEASGHRVRILDLETLIEVKKETASDKDKAIISILQRTLEEKLKQ